MILYTEEIKLKEENRLFYSDTGETKELGCIGHLRGDFGHDGKEFWTTWFPHENHEKNDEVFREIFDRVINLCREKGNPLFNRGDMRTYCRENPECRLDTGNLPMWGFRIPTQDYMLYLRCCPDVVGDYNFYVYAYCRVTDSPKTQTSRRVIPIPRQILPLLREQKKKSRSTFVVCEDRVQSVRSYQYSFSLLLKKLGIPHHGFHALRHTFATRALECGMDVKTLSEILGHKNSAVTLNRYVHSLMPHKHDAMNRLGKLF